MATAPKVAASEHALTSHSNSHKWLIAFAVLLGATLEVLDSSIVNVSLPNMQGSFSASVDQITWVLTSYIVANGIMIPMTGWISARFGRKRYFITSVICFVIASGLCGAAGSLSEIVVFRLIQGIAGAAMIPSSQAILMETFPPEEQGMAMALWGVGLMAAPVLGPTLGGWITDHWSWRWNFYINLPTGIVAAIMVSTFVHDPEYLRKAKSAARRVDYMGITYLVVGLGLMEIVLNRGQRADWFASTWVCIFSAVSALALILLIIHELRFPEPILDLRICKIFQFDIAVGVIMALVMVIYSANLLNPLFFQDLLGYTAWNAGLAVVPRGIGTLCAMLVVGELSRRGLDTRWLIGLGFSILAYALWQMSQWTLGVGMTDVRWPIFISGIGAGFIFPILSASTLSCVAPERMGYAASLYNMMRAMGGAIGISTVTDLLSSSAQVHQSRLVGHFRAVDAWRLDHAPALPGAPNLNLLGGLNSHQLQGFGIIYQEIERQALLLAYNDVYRLLALIALLFIPAFKFLNKTSHAGPRVIEIE